MKRTLLSVMAALVVVLSACADDSGNDDATSVASDSTAPDAAEGSEPTDSQEPDGEPQANVPDDWATQLIAAFDAFAEATEAADRIVGERMALENQQGLTGDELQEMFNEALADRMDLLAAGADELLAGLPDAVPHDVEPALAETHDALVDLVAAFRTAGDGIRVGDTATYNGRVEPAEAFELACATLQNAVRDLDEGLVACGIPGEDPESPIFEAGPTVDDSNEDEPAEFVDMPAGSYELGYVGPAGIRDILVELNYETGLLIRSSRQLVELAITDDGPTTRIHASEFIANPLDLQTAEVRDQLLLDGPLIAGDASRWIDALDGITVVATGDGDIGGIAARSWDLLSERKRRSPCSATASGCSPTPPSNRDDRSGSGRSRFPNRPCS